MNSIAYNNPNTTPQSIIKITENTSVPYLTRHFQIEPILTRYVQYYLKNNPEWLFERSYHYRKMFWYSGWNLQELVEFLKTFHTQKLCWVLHERWGNIHIHQINPDTCRNKIGNPCCMHPEETGLLYAIIAANHILRGFHMPSIDPTELWPFISNIGWVDADVQRRSTQMMPIIAIFKIMWHEQKDAVREYAMEEQKAIWSTVQSYIEIFVSGLQSLIDSGATLPNASPPQEKSLPKVELARIL